MQRNKAAYKDLRSSLPLDKAMDDLVVRGIKFGEFDPHAGRIGLSGNTFLGPCHLGLHLDFPIMVGKRELESKVGAFGQRLVGAQEHAAGAYIGGQVIGEVAAGDIDDPDAYGHARILSLLRCLLIKADP